MKPFKELMGQVFREKVYCGLDIGSRRIKAGLARVLDADNFRLLAVHDVETKGFIDGVVTDIGAFSGAISAVLDGVSQKSRIKFRDVFIGLGGDLLETRLSRAVVPLTERGNKVIMPSDVRNARHQARLLGVKLEEEVIDDLVRQFRVDDINVALDPVGLYGRKIEVESLLVVAGITRLRNIHKAVRQTGYEVSDTFFNTSALSEAALEKARRQEGAVLLDAGARKTEVMVFRDGLLKHYQVVPLGGDHISRRLAKELAVSFELAEDIKKSYVRLGDAVSSGEEVLIKKEQGFVPVKRELISRIAAEEVNALAGRVRAVLDTAAVNVPLSGGVSIAGGGAMMTGMMESLERSLSMTVKTARGIPTLTNAPVYAVSASLAEMGYKGGLRYVFDSRKPKDWMAAVGAKAEEICNEYF